MMFTNTFQLPNHSSLLELPIKKDVYQQLLSNSQTTVVSRNNVYKYFQPPRPDSPWSVSAITLT